MKDYVKQRAKAARWLYERYDKAQWWGWGVLTEHNPADDRLNIHDNVAFNIFTDLANRGLLIPYWSKDGKEAFKINMADDKEWERVINPPGFLRLYVFKPAALVLKTWIKFLLWFASIIITALVTAYFRSLF